MDCSVYFKFQSWIYEPGVQGETVAKETCIPLNLKMI